ncbi:MAG TPA: CusA/CzcA family heavy metal efflux RND transporter [bacterium]|nr:CusA/CzcA family heavy metal efflux RND transporter [bacterium]
MIAKLIEWSIRNRFMVMVMTVLIMVVGIYTIGNIAVDAIPDLSDVQVIIQTDYPGQGPQIVEDQVTYPLATAMLSVPYAKVVRGYSFFGTSFVYIIFEDGTDLYWARSRVLEYMNTASKYLPPGVTPQLGPDATGVGWIYEYALIDPTGKHDLQELRSLQDYYLKYELVSLPGVAEVASVGGYVKQYQVEADPIKLLAYHIPLSQVKMAIRESNNDVGGRLIEMGETEFMVRGLGYIKSVEDLENIALGVDQNGTPILLRQVADVHIGPELRRGLAEYNGEGEAVGGIIVMRWGENAREVIERVKKRLAELKAGLPEGVRIVPVYDRSGLIDRAIETLRAKLIEEIIVVTLVCIVFLVHLRSSFVAAIALPLGVLMSLITMHLLKINANIMSLGGIAIAIGVMVDASVVMVENAHKHIERDQDQKPHLDIIMDAAKEVGPALFFSLLIIVVSFLPVFALGEQSGRLFKPLAYTKTFAMAWAAIISVTLIPVLMYYFVRGKIMREEKHPLSRFFIWIYRPLIDWALRRRITVILAAALIMAVTILPLQNLLFNKVYVPLPGFMRQLGSEFMPALWEGDLLYMPTTLPGISIAKARELLQQTDKIIRRFPEVKSVFGKIGHAESATDPAPLSMIETVIQLKDPREWRPGMTREKLKQELSQALKIPGLSDTSWDGPIKIRIDMLSTGFKSPVGIKVMGDDLDKLVSLSSDIESVLMSVKGTRGTFSERTTGGNYVDFKINRDQIARYGLSVADVEDLIMSAAGGMNVTRTVEGLERYPVNLRYPREYRDHLDSLRNLLVPTSGGAQVPIAQLADIVVHKGPAMVKSENARKTNWLFIYLDTPDVGGYVGRAQDAVAQKIKLPPGYSIIWSGQYEYMEAARKRLQVVIPLAVAIIFLLLYIHFGNMAESMIVMVSLPFALVGGVWLMSVLGYQTSVAVYVGFIALGGLAAETGVVMLVYLDEVYGRMKREGRMRYRSDLRQAVIEGAVLRVRPKLMTVGTTLIGLLPIMFGVSTGSEVMKRIAAPMVGGLISSTILTLIVIPAIYAMVKARTVQPDPPPSQSEASPQ